MSTKHFDPKKVFIIAEAGVNHNGDVATAKRMIDAARKAGADAIKFQTFKAEDVASRTAPKAAYQKAATGKEESHLEMLRRLELSRRAHRILFDYCRIRSFFCLSSPFDLGSISLLEDLNVEVIKVPSGEITNLPYLRKLGSLRKNVILSTGMADLEEVGQAIGVLTDSGTKKEDITVMHCTGAYPAPSEEANLLAIRTLKETFSVRVGYSDHTIGIETALAAVALGARVIEKHFTLSRKMKGPDHKASATSREFAEMVRAIRNVETALGDGIKRHVSCERHNRSVVRKCIVAAREIKKGEMLNEMNITTKRPARGMSPMKWDSVIGSIAGKDYKKDEPIKPGKEEMS